MFPISASFVRRYASALTAFDRDALVTAIQATLRGSLAGWLCASLGDDRRWTQPRWVSWQAAVPIAIAIRPPRGRIAREGATLSPCR
jgi:hypothetical protein